MACAKNRIPIAGAAASAVPDKIGYKVAPNMKELRPVISVASARPKAA